MVETLAANLYRRGLFGFFALDLVAFLDPFSKPDLGQSQFANEWLFWANGLTAFYSEAHANYSLVSVVTDRYEENLDKNIIILPRLQYSYIPTIHYKSFFHLTRLESLYFDIQSKTGIMFLLAESLQSGLLGLVCVENELDGVYGLAIKSLAFLRRQTEEKKEKFDRFNTKNDLPQLGDVFGKLKIDLKGILASFNTLKTASSANPLAIRQ